MLLCPAGHEHRASADVKPKTWPNGGECIAVARQKKTAGEENLHQFRPIFWCLSLTNPQNASQMVAGKTNMATKRLLANMFGGGCAPGTDCSRTGISLVGKSVRAVLAKTPFGHGSQISFLLSCITLQALWSSESRLVTKKTRQKLWNSENMCLQIMIPRPDLLADILMKGKCCVHDCKVHAEKESGLVIFLLPALDQKSLWLDTLYLHFGGEWFGCAYAG